MENSQIMKVSDLTVICLRLLLIKYFLGSMGLLASRFGDGWESAGIYVNWRISYELIWLASLTVFFIFAPLISRLIVGSRDVSLSISTGRPQVILGIGLILVGAHTGILALADLSAWVQYLSAEQGELGSGPPPGAPGSPYNLTKDVVQLLLGLAVALIGWKRFSGSGKEAGSPPQ